MRRPYLPRRESRAFIMLMDEFPGREFAVWWTAVLWNGRAYRRRKSWMELR